MGAVKMGKGKTIEEVVKIIFAQDALPA